MSTSTTPKFTPEEQARIDKELAEYKKKARQAEVDAYIINKQLDEERKQPGKKYY
jgi:uncharacterized protein YfcZ (UPF0381/DUF406 family)